MLEAGDVLHTWALAELPNNAASSRLVAAERLADHRLAYLDYEGPVSGERGNVVRVDAGTFDVLAQSADCWRLAINGKLLNGRLTLERDESGERRWTLKWE